MSELDDLLRRKAGLGTQVDIPKAELPADTNPHASVDTSVPREGIPGQPRVITAQRGGRNGSRSKVKITRGGTSGQPTEVTSERGGELGSHTEVTSSLPPSVEPTQVDTAAKRGGTPGTITEPGEYKHAEDTNSVTIQRTSKYLDAIEYYQKYGGKYIDDLKGWLNGRVGLNIPSYDQANTWLKSLTGGQGTEVVANADLKNEDLVGYVAHLFKDPSALWRIPVDIALRLLIKSQVDGKASLREYQEMRKDADIINWEDGRRKEKLRPQSDSVEDYLGYRLEGGQIKSFTNKVAKTLITHGFGGNEMNTLVGGTGDKATNYFTTYQRMHDFEFSDSFFWGLNIRAFDSAGSGFGKSLLPKFPEEFSAGWWPVTSCSFTKGSLQSKSFQLPFFKLEIPALGERPSNLKLSVVDNARHAIRYWLEDYVRKTFDVDNNIVLPYKNICWDITVYRYDCTLNTLYSKQMICLLSSYNAPFLGMENHGYDEIDLEFEIVGEYTEDNKKTRVDETMNNFEQKLAN